MLMKENIKFLSTIFIVFGVSMALYALYTEIKMLKEDVKYLKRNRQEFDECEVDEDFEDAEEDSNEQIEDYTEEEIAQMMMNEAEWKKSMAKEYLSQVNHMHLHPEERFTINMTPIQELEEEEIPRQKSVEPEAKSMVSENMSLFEMLEKENSVQESTEETFKILAEDIKQQQEKETKKHSKRGRKPKQPQVVPLEEPIFSPEQLVE